MDVLVGGCWKGPITGFRVWLGASGEGLSNGGCAMDWMLSESGSKSVVAYLNKPDLQKGEA